MFQHMSAPPVEGTVLAAWWAFVNKMQVSVKQVQLMETSCCWSVGHRRCRWIVVIVVVVIVVEGIEPDRRRRCTSFLSK